MEVMHCNGVSWLLLDRRYGFDALGYIPDWISADSSEPVSKQINDRYGHGGGWRPFGGLTLNKSNNTLNFPGDPPMKPIAMAVLHGETILFYPHAWVLVLQKDGKFEASRID